MHINNNNTNQLKLPPGIIWRCHSKYVDVDTGEIINEKIAKDKNKYIIIKTIKNAKINQLQTKGTIKYTRECRKQPQQKLSFD